MNFKIHKIIVLSSILLFFLFPIKNTYSQNVIQNDGYYFIDGKLFSGIFKKENNEIISRLSIKKGLLDGISEYYKNENLVEKRAFKNGKKHGVWEKFENNNLISKANYLRDKKHGKWLIWDSNGVLRYEMYYKRGNKCGTWKMWDENGRLINEKKH